MTERLDEAAIAAALPALPDWRRTADGRAIERRWRLADFAEAFALVGRIAVLAEAAQHHPDIAFGWGRVSATLTTHDAGGLSRKDLDLARRIEAG